MQLKQKSTIISESRGSVLHVINVFELGNNSSTTSLKSLLQPVCMVPSGLHVAKGSGCVCIVF